MHDAFLRKRRAENQVITSVTRPACLFTNGEVLGAGAEIEFLELADALCRG